MIRRCVFIPWRSIVEMHTSRTSLLLRECTYQKATYLRNTCTFGTLHWNKVSLDGLRRRTISNGTKSHLSTTIEKKDEKDDARLCNDISTDANLPTKELLFQIDWIFETLVPGFMKARLRPFLDITSDNVIFVDRIFNYNFVGKSRLISHIAKVRAYYRYLSPYNKVEMLGSCIYEGEDVIVILWRLSSLKSNFFSYLPRLPTNRQDEMNIVEGAMDIHVTKEGQIYQIVNRKITASDLEGAKVMAEMKKEVDEERMKAERRKWARQLDDMMQDRAVKSAPIEAYFKGIGGMRTPIGGGKLEEIIERKVYFSMYNVIT